MNSLIKKLRLEELLALIVFFVIFILAFLGRKPLFENLRQSVLSYSYLSFLIMFLLGYSVVIFISKKNQNDNKFHKMLDILRDWLPVFVVIVVYESLKHLHLDDIIHYLGISQKDNIMLNIDNYLFGQTPSVLMQSIINYPLTKISELAYDSYYFYFPILGIVLYARGKQKEFRIASLTFILIAYIGYVFYLLIPVAGPQFEGRVIYSSELYIFGRNAVQQTIDLLRFDLDCFPSLHTAQPLAILIIAYKYERKLFYILLLPIITTIFSTMYLRYHYGIDVIAGIILAVVVVKIAPSIFNKYQRQIEINNELDEIEFEKSKQVYAMKSK